MKHLFLTLVYQQMKIQKKTIKLGYQLFPYQSDVIKGILKYPHDIHTVKSRRQTGKSVTIETILMLFAINRIGSCSIAVSPTLGQGRKMFKEVKKALQGTPIFESANSTTLDINLTTGSSILFKSAEQQDGLRGHTCTGILCIDECAYIKDDIVYQCLPFVDARRAPILITSTPLFKRGVFYDFYKNGLEGKNGFHSYDVCDYDTSALLSPEKLEIYRQSVSPQIFRSDYLGQFITENSEIFGDLKKLCKGVVHKSTHRTIGIDWSTGGLDSSNDPDETAIAIMNEFRELEYIEGFHDKDTNQTIDYIIDKIVEYGVEKCVVETNSMGRVYIDLLKRKIASKGIRCSVIEFTTTNDTKRQIIEDLAVHCSNGTITLIEDNKLFLQMLSFQIKKTPTNKVTYEAGTGHDDLVLALAFCLYGTRKGNYSVR